MLLNRFYQISKTTEKITQDILDFTSEYFQNIAGFDIDSLYNFFYEYFLESLEYILLIEEDIEISKDDENKADKYYRLNVDDENKADKYNRLNVDDVFELLQLRGYFDIRRELKNYQIIC